MNRLDDDAKKVLQDLMEKLGESSDVLLGIGEYLNLVELRYFLVIKRFSRAATFIIVGLTICGGSAFLLMGQLNNAQQEANALIEENRMLLSKLRKVTVQAQLNGARADATQCREIEALKTQIRATLKLSPRINTKTGQETLERFKRKRCSVLPNAKPIVP